MASIIKRRKKFSVVYRYIDEQGNERQKWETFATMAEAKKRKLEVEFKQESNEFVAPTTKTVNDLLSEYMSIYGLNTWAISTYEGRQALISNYISPLIGEVLLDDVTPRMMDKFYRELLSVKSVGSKYTKPRNEFVSPHIVREIHKLLRNAFNQAVKWELMSRNPVEHATLPKEEHVPRDIWTADILFKALDACEDDNLLLAMNLAFSCTLRMGELLGLTWDCVDISQTSIDSGQAYIFVNKELQRVRRDALEALGEKGVIRKFPMAIRAMNTLLVLKEPKTKTSVRKIFLPRSVAEMLAQHKRNQDEIKDLFGEEYTDYGLVFASTNGRPMEASNITRLFNDLIRKNDLPKVVFHSLRHTSITYKLKLNGGDMKSVQGDSGHAQLKMVADVYSHIIDDDRCLNAQRMEEAFYAGQKKPEEVVVVPPASQIESRQNEDITNNSAEEENADTALLMRLLQKPEMAQLLKTLAQNL
ncbi:MAG: site-specific integrase [Lachnospiraceae bacterium]|nr:site-specific integrase [Lachnospiraceae bacterium]